MKKEELIKRYELRLNAAKSSRFQLDPKHDYYAERKAQYDCEIRLLGDFIRDLRKL